MPVMFSFEAVGSRDAAGRFARMRKRLMQEQRTVVQEAAREYVAALQLFAPHDTGVFAAGITFRTQATSAGTTATVYVKGEHAWLLPIIREGSVAHEIPKGGSAAQMAKGYPLHWIDEETGEDRFAWSVWHPGTKPDPFVEAAQAAQREIVRTMVNQVAARVVGV